MMKIDSFLDLLKNVKKAGTNKWMACCPAHNDGQQPGHQSLSIRIDGDKILLKCFAGCNTADIVKVLNLTMSDLFIGVKKSKYLKTGSPEKDNNKRHKIVTIYPYHDQNGKLVFEVVRYEPKGFSQRRPDGKGGYIYNLTGIKRVIYRLPQVLESIKEGKTIFHCEGEKDVDNLVKLGLAATTSPMGSASWKPGFAEFYKGAKQLIVLPDKDQTGYEYAQEVALSLFDIVPIIKILELPGDNVKDVSDWISAGGTHDELLFLVSTISPWIRSTALISLDYDEIRKTLKNTSDNQYTIDNRSFCRIITTKDNKETYSLPLCNFIAILTGDVYKDSGAAIHRFLKLKGKLNGNYLPEIIIPESQFDGLVWVRRDWGAKAQIEKSIDKVERHIVQAIIKSSGTIKEEVLYTHTGWREINGKMTYLTNAGGIGMPDIKVELTPQLTRYRLPQPEGNPTEAIKKSLGILDIAEPEVSIPTFILPYLAVLNVFEEIPFTAFYVGESGGYKSVLTALAMSHFGNFTHKTLPASWYGTKTELEKLAFYAKDILFAIDDYAPPADSHEAREINNTVGYILRAYGNRQGKVRSHVDLTSQETFPPRGFLVTSGEHLPPAGVSRSARTLPIPVSKEDFQRGSVDEDYYLLTQAQKDAAFYPIAMSHFIKWIIDNWERTYNDFHQIFEEYRAIAAKRNTHLRLTESIALMQTAFFIITKFAKEKGVLNDKERQGLISTSWIILQGLLNLQNEQIISEKPGIRFLEVLQSLLLSGRAALRRRYPEGEWTNSEASPGQTWVGWDDGNEDFVCLNREEAFNAVYIHCQRHGEFFGMHQAETWRNLMHIGYLRLPEGATTPTILKKINGVTIRVLPVKREKLFPIEE